MEDKKEELVKDYKIIGSVNTEDNRLNYDIIDFNQLKLREYKAPISDEGLDFLVPLNDEAKKKGHEVPLPLSFFNIDNVEDGTIWYMNRFPRLSPEIAEIMSRYNFGDLKYKTKKQIKNYAKKYKKKNNNVAPPFNLEKKKNPFIVYFD